MHSLIYCIFLATERKSLNSVMEKTSQSSANSKSVNRQESCVTVARKPLGHGRSPKLVSLMLSSPVTLLTMSIRKGQLTQTKQIIKVCILWLYIFMYHLN